MKDITARKVWVGGPERDHTAVTLELYRQIEGGDRERVDVQATVSRDGSTFHYVWANLPVTDEDGNVYFYSVDEPNVPKNYTAKVKGMTVTNTYASPLQNVTAKKVWIDGPAMKPTVWFRLYRTIGDVTEPVPGAQILALPNGRLTVTWEDIAQTDLNGVPYVFSVREVDEDGNDFVPDHYVKAESGLRVVNTYESPLADVTAKKIWVGGPEEDHVQVTLRLYRQANGGEREAVEAVPTVTRDGATYTYVWANLAVTDSKGRIYNYTVAEVEVPYGYEAAYAADSLTVTNTWILQSVIIDKVDQDGKPLAGATFTITNRNGKITQTVVSNEEGKIIFTNLPYGSYDLVEDSAPEGYDGDDRTFHVVISASGVKVSYRNEDITQIVNTKKPTMIEIEGTKYWKKDKPADRPESIVVVLFKNGTEIDRLTVTAKENWKYSFGEHVLIEPDGTEHKYRVGEIVPEGDEVAFDGFDLINTRIKVKPVPKPDPKPTPKPVVKPSENPRTGDAGVVGSLLIALAAGTGLALTRKRRKK